jgi:transcriptional regulator with XRE-family HTH domain
MTSEQTDKTHEDERDDEWEPGWKLVGQRLRTAREYLNLSQQHVADRTGIPRTALSDVERGARKVDILELRKLGRLYRRPIGYFLDQDPEAALADHAAAMLARTLSPLSEGDREKVVSFAQYLQFAHAAEQEQKNDPEEAGR